MVDGNAHFSMVRVNDESKVVRTVLWERQTRLLAVSDLSRRRLFYSIKFPRLLSKDVCILSSTSVLIPCKFSTTLGSS